MQIWRHACGSGILSPHAGGWCGWLQAGTWRQHDRSDIGHEGGASAVESSAQPQKRDAADRIDRVDLDPQPGSQLDNAVHQRAKAKGVNRNNWVIHSLYLGGLTCCKFDAVCPCLNPNIGK